jgi:hypothetical protein
MLASREVAPGLEDVCDAVYGSGSDDCHVEIVDARLEVRYGCGN